MRNRVKYSLAFFPMWRRDGLEYNWKFLNDLIGIWFILLNVLLTEFHEMMYFRHRRKGKCSIGWLI